MHPKHWTKLELSCCPGGFRCFFLALVAISGGDAGELSVQQVLDTYGKKEIVFVVPT